MADYEFEQSKRSSAESKNGASRMTLTLNVRVRKDELGRKVIEVAADGHAEAYDKGWINESRHRSAQFFFDVQITRKREIGSDYILRKVVMVEVDDTGHVHASYQWMKAQNIVFDEEPTEMNGITYASFRDEDDNVFLLKS